MACATILQPLKPTANFWFSSIFRGYKMGTLKRKTFWTVHNPAYYPASISSVNLTKSAGNCRFGHIYWRNLQWKTSFFVVSVRLVNPPKNEVGRLSKSIIEPMKKEFRQKLNWINGKMYKRWHWLVQEYKRETPSQIFDIKDSYPSITGYLLKWFLNLAEKYINIYNDGKVIKVFYF